ncbi:MAG: hypothetical protein WDW21_03835 [Neisseriaceae bacterium]
MINQLVLEAGTEALNCRGKVEAVEESTNGRTAETSKGSEKAEVEKEIIEVGAEFTESKEEAIRGPLPGVKIELIIAGANIRLNTVCGKKSAETVKCIGVINEEEVLEISKNREVLVNGRVMTLCSSCTTAIITPARAASTVESNTAAVEERK